MPRYFTTGLSATRVRAGTKSRFAGVTGTSAHQYQGETPICSESA
jgi:hypothetical protein